MGISSRQRHRNVGPSKLGVGLKNMFARCVCREKESCELKKFVMWTGIVKDGPLPATASPAPDVPGPQMVKITRASLSSQRTPAPPLSIPPSQRSSFFSLISPLLPLKLQHSRVDILHIDNTTVARLGPNPRFHPADHKARKSAERMLARLLYIAAPLR